MVTKDPDHEDRFIDMRRFGRQWTAPPGVTSFLARYPTIWVTDDTLVHYARLYRTLVRSTQTVGANDLWIAASATEHNLPLLTRNVSEFGRVAGLKVVDYSGPE